MTAAGQPHPIPAIPPQPEGAGPHAILAEERADFDQAYRRALPEIENGTAETANHEF